MPPSIAEGPDGPLTPAPAASHPRARVVGLFIVLGALALYAASNLVHANTYNHFVWQADAFLHGRAWFPYPVNPGEALPQNWYFQDVYPLFGPDGAFDGRVLLPFPPLPALVLLPFVAAFGLGTDQEAVGLGLGVLGVALAWWSLGGLAIRTSVRAVAVGVFATGTAWWWATAVSSTWYLAHLVATDLALVAVGIALRRDPLASDEGPRRGAELGGDGRDVAGRPRWRLARLGGALWPLDRSQVLVGLLLGIAVTARLPLIFAAPFFMLVGGGGAVPRRTVSAAAGGVLPVVALLAYTWLTTGAPVHPGYDFQYRREVAGYPALGYTLDYGVEDPRYIPRNLGIMLGTFPVLFPDVLPNTLGIAAEVPLCTEPGAMRTPFDPDCPIAVPVDLGTSLLLSAPGLLLALVAFRWHGRSRLGLGAAGAVLLVAAFNLAHFSQGWVQWGYRFSLDFLPFLLPMVALGAASRTGGGPRLVAWLLLALGAVVNLWGVTWGQLLAW